MKLRHCFLRFSPDLILDAERAEHPANRVERYCGSPSPLITAPALNPPVLQGCRGQLLDKNGKSSLLLVQAAAFLTSAATSHSTHQITSP